MRRCSPRLGNNSSRLGGGKSSSRIRLDHHVWDVVIVGAGVVGSATAWRLGKRSSLKAAAAGSNGASEKTSVLLLEQFASTHHDRGSSHGASRIVRKTYPQDHYSRAMKAAYPLWEELEREAQEEETNYHDGRRILFHKTGSLDFAPIGDPSLEEIRESSIRHGIPHEELSASEANRRFPPLRLPDSYRAVYSPDGGIVEASKSVEILQNLAREKYGTEIRSNTRLIDIVVATNKDGPKEEEEPATVLKLIVEKTKQPESNDQQKDDDVNNNNENDDDSSSSFLLAKNVVFAAGAWASTLLPALSCLKDTPRFSKIPLRPKRVTVTYWNVVPETQPQLQLLKEEGGQGGFPVFIDYHNGVYGLPSHEHPDLLKVCDHDGPYFGDPCKRDSIDHTDRAVSTVRKTLRFLPGVISDKPARTENCMYTMTPDEDFVLDFVSLGSNNNNDGDSTNPRQQQLPRFCIASTCSGHGFKFAPLIGDTLASFVLGDDDKTGSGGSDGFDLDKLSASREFKPW